MRFIRVIICLLICSILSLACATPRDGVAVQKHADLVWAKPDGFQLSADIYVPDTGATSYPVLIIYHGGGWLLNSNSIMNDMAHYMASHGRYVVVNTNYRLLSDQNNTVTVNEIVEDAMGAMLWVKANIAKYGGNPDKIVITGDSAGGHLAAMVMLAGRQLESDGFVGDSLGFNPSWLPEGQTAEDIAEKDGLSVQATVLSYTAFDLFAMASGGFETDKNPFWGWAKTEPRSLFGDGFGAGQGVDTSVDTRPDLYRAVSPVNYIPDASDYQLPPQFVLVGSKDKMTTPKIARQYVKRMKQAGQPIKLKIYQNRGHGFLDSGCNDYTDGCFDQLAVQTLDDMIRFIDKALSNQ